MKPSERKHLSMRLFHKNKDSRSKDQNRNDFYSIFPFEFFFHVESKYNFRSFALSLGDTFEKNAWKISNIF